MSRFRRDVKVPKPKSITSNHLGDLSKMFVQQHIPKVGPMSAPQAMTDQQADAIVGHANSSQPEFDEAALIWNWMDNGSLRTVSEIKTAFPTIETKFIEAVMNWYATNGFFNRQRLPGSGEFSYSKRKKAKRPDIETVKRGVAKFRLPEVINKLDPKGDIQYTEGIDVAIWKLMAADKRRKFYTVAEIGRILATFGFDPAQVKDRVITLQHHSWFDRMGSGITTQYKLKKHITMPTNKQVEEVKAQFTDVPIPASAETPVVKQVVPSPMVTAQSEVFNMPNDPRNPNIVQGDKIDVAIWKVLCDGKPYSVTDINVFLKDFGFGKSSAGARIVTWRNTLNLITSSDDKPQKHTLRPGVPMPVDGLKHYDVLMREIKERNKEKPVTKAAIVVTDKTSPQQQSLLNVESEQKPVVKAKVDDKGSDVKVGNVLSATPRPPIMPHKSSLLGKTTPKPTFIPAPPNPMDEAAKASKPDYGSSLSGELAKKPVIDPTSVLPLGFPIPKSPTKTIKEAINTPNLDINPSLMNVTMQLAAITLKGLDFTPDEAHALLRELTAAGYGKQSMKKVPSSLLKIKVEIRGVIFDTDELETITVEMKKYLE